jgi:Family of unknown function (DUF5752)
MIDGAQSHGASVNKGQLFHRPFSCIRSFLMSQISYIFHQGELIPVNTIAITPFHFYTRQNLTYLTQRKAANLSELLDGLKKVSAASIYQHTHRFLQQFEFLSPEPPNDFAYWVSSVLRDEELGEKIASIHFLQFHSLETIRQRLIEVLEESLTPSRTLRTVPPGMEFRFMEAQTFVSPTKHTAQTLEEFRDCLQAVSVRSIYYHMF